MVRCVATCWKELLGKVSNLTQNADGSVNHIANLSTGLSFPDRGFDIVTALDVIEHTESIRTNLDECWRIARHGLLVALPNIAHLSHRWRFLMTGRIGAKFDLHFELPTDRHRWLTVQSQCDSFMVAFAASHDAELQTTWNASTLPMGALARLGRTVGLSPALWV